MNSVPAFLLICLLSFAAMASPTVDAQFALQIHRYFSQQAKTQKFSGGVAVVLGERILFRKSYGLADLSTEIQNQPQFPFPLASISKQFLAAGVLKAISMGKMKLSAPITDYLPHATNWRGVTVQGLLSHSSGLMQITKFPGFFSVIGTTIPLPDLVDLFLREPLNGPPGKTFEYSQYGYHVLARALEVAVKMPYSQFLQKTVFQPAGMRSTRNYREDHVVPNLARGTGVDELGVRPKLFSRTTVGNRSYEHFISMSAVGAGGDIVSSLDDMIRWDLALRSDRLFSDDELALYQSELFEIKQGLSYGFGWDIEKTQHGKLMSHSGGLAGISTMIERYLDTPLTIIVLSNRVCGFKDPNVNRTCSARFHSAKVSELFFGRPSRLR